MRCQLGWFLLEPLRETLFHTFQLLVAAGTPRCSLACGCITPVLASLSHGLLCVSMCKFPSFYMDTSHWIRAWFIMLTSFSISVASITTGRLINRNLITAARPYFQIRSCPQVLGVRTWTSLCGEDTTQPRQVKLAFIISPGACCCTVP